MYHNLDLLPICHYIAKAAERPRDLGINIQFSRDFHELARIQAKLEKAPLTPMFDPRFSDIGPHNGFWMKGVTEGGEIVHTQAARIDDLGNGTLCAFLESMEAYYRFPDQHRAAGEYCLSPAKATKRITGRVCYQGEFWLKGGAHGMRGRHLVAPLCQLAKSLILTLWQPDFTYAMVQPRIVHSGMVRHYAYTQMEPHGIIWHRPQLGQTLDEWVIWRSGWELEDQIIPSVISEEYLRSA